MRFRFRPRHVLRFHAAGIAFLAVTAVWLNWSASARSVKRYRREIANELQALRLEIASVRQSAASLPSTVATAGRVNDPIALAATDVPRPRLLGRGMTRAKNAGPLFYFDVVDSLGDVRRYYTPTNPLAVRGCFRQIADDCARARSDYVAGRFSVPSGVPEYPGFAE